MLRGQGLIKMMMAKGLTLYSLEPAHASFGRQQPCAALHDKACARSEKGRVRMVQWQHAQFGRVHGKLVNVQ